MMMFNGVNVRISPSAIIGQNVKIGDGTVIHDNVVIGDNCIICNDCVIGEPLAAFYNDLDYSNPKTVIGDNALIRSHSIIYANNSMGTHFETGHRIIIRERTQIGNHCRIGSMSDLQGDLILGDYCQLHSSVHLCKNSRLGNFVFMYPFSLLANDKYPPTTEIYGPVIEDYTQIGAHASIISFVKVGKHCLIAANSTVTKNFEDYSFLAGSPAIRKSDIRELKDENGTPLYPWKERFSRGMPWECA
ncbi:DapH/DapD/GlmU-related protein [Bacteroidota bacterium]